MILQLLYNMRDTDTDYALVELRTSTQESSKIVLQIYKHNDYLTINK